MNVQVNGVILYYEKQGSGPPLVLLHGNGEDGRIFDRQHGVRGKNRAVPS